MNYDVLVIGGGPAGYTAAIQAAKENLKVAMIEKDELGGTCLNRGCIPTKALLHVANTYDELKHSNDMGLEFNEPSIDQDKVYQYKNEIVAKLVSGIDSLIKANKIALFHDTASFIDDHTIKLALSNEMISAKNIIIATGARPIRLPLPGMDLSCVYTSDDILSKPIKEKTIVIIGGGVIGCELATFYHQSGCEVTIIELQSRILSTIDRELAQNLNMAFKKKGINIITNAQVKAIDMRDGQAICHYQKDDQDNELICNAIILSIGRKPNSDQLDLEKINIITERGYIKVNANYQTSVENIYAIGDINGGIQLAHVAAAQAIDCIKHIIDKPAPYLNSTVPYCIYTKPEIAYLGITEDEAKSQNISYQASKFIMSNNGKYLIESNERGFIKVIFENDVIIGAQLFMDKATEFAAYFATAIDNKLTYQQLTKIIFPHPTMSEGIKETIENIHQQSIHIAPIKR